MAIAPMNDPAHDASPDGPGGRWASALIGALFVAIAGAIVYLAGREAGWAAYLVAGIVGVLGAEALLCAVRNRRCLLSRIGPLP